MIREPILCAKSLPWQPICLRSKCCIVRITGHVQSTFSVSTVPNSQKVAQCRLQLPTDQQYQKEMVHHFGAQICNA